MDIKEIVDEKDRFVSWRKPLEDALKEKIRIMRLEITSEQLVDLEDTIQDTVMRRAKAQALVTQRPNFEWWSMTGLWPRDDGGWTVLLRLTPYNVQMQQMPMSAIKP